MNVDFIARTMRPLFKRVAVNANAAAEDTLNITTASTAVRAKYLRNVMARIAEAEKAHAALMVKKAWVEELLDEVRYERA